MQKIITQKTTYPDGKSTEYKWYILDDEGLVIRDYKGELWTWDGNDYMNWRDIENEHYTNQS